MKSIFIFGPPGVGKGTQAAFIKQSFDCKSVTTGDLLRSEVAKKSPLGEQISLAMQNGSLVDASIVEQIMVDEINRLKSLECETILMDGYPRSLEQFSQLESITQKCGLEHSCVINLTADIDTLVGRISGRFFCKKCGAIYHKDSKKPALDGACDECGSHEFGTRDDDKEEILRKRFQVFNDESFPVLEKFGNLVFNINGIDSVDSVSSQIKNIITNSL